MARKPAPSADWLPCSPSDLRIGDAVKYSMFVTREHNGGILMREENGRTFPVRPKVEIKGRIVDVLPSDSGPKIVVEWTSAGPDKYGDAMLPPRVGVPSEKTLTSSTAQLARMPSQGPAVRFNEVGRRYLLDLLRMAAGGDDKSDEAIARVAACVDAEEIERADAADEHPRQVGWSKARAMLAGRERYSEAVFRQLRGWWRVDVSLPSDGKPTIVEGEIDPEVAAVMRQFPGTKVIDVRMTKGKPEDPHSEIPY